MAALARNDGGDYSTAISSSVHISITDQSLLGCFERIVLKIFLGLIIEMGLENKSTSWNSTGCFKG